MREISNNIRKSLLKAISKSNSSHSGSALSVVDILTVLYFKILDIDPEDPNKVDRDRFILSKGHASIALYSTLAERGYFPIKLLDQFYCDNGILPGHLDKEAVPGVEVSSGSLGHGLSIGLGMAIASKVDEINYKVVVVCGDGELNEGSMWEAIMFAPQKNLDNLTLIVDYNKLQGYGKTSEVIDLEPLRDKFLAFNWSVIEINGHDFNKIENALLKKSKIPKVIIAHTIKGKGVSYMENELAWHYRSPNKEQLKQAIDELS